MKESKLCLACESSDLVELIDLGIQPHANDYSTDGTVKFKESLVLLGCKRCGHAQQKYLVTPDLLFEDYHYASGTSNTLKKYFDEYAVELKRDPAVSSILEIACNDGSFLDSLRDQGFSPLVGVDPAGNIVEAAASKGHQTYVDYFGTEFAAGHDQRYSLIVGQNVLAHTPDPLDLLLGAANLLTPDGQIHIQTSQSNMLFNGEFDTVYHEHYSFFGAHSMKALAKRAGLVLCEISYPPVHGTSFRFVLKKAGSEGVSVKDRLHFEEQAGLIDGRCFADFRALAEDRVNAFRNHMKEWTREGRQVIGVGVAAKAVTFFNYADILPHRFVDEAPLKIGKYFPGTSVVIEPLDAVRDCEPGSVFVIGAWNFFDELMQKLGGIRGEQGGSDLYVRYLPETQVCQN